MEEVDEKRSIRVLSPKLVLQRVQPALQWLIGSPFFSPLTIVSTLRCVHCLPPPESLSPDYLKEAEELRTLLLKGFYIIGALVVGNSNVEENASKAIDAARKLKKLLSPGEKPENQSVVGVVADINSADIHFFVSEYENCTTVVSVTSVIYESNPENYIWEKGCLLRCELPMNLPIYIPVNSPLDVEKMCIHATGLVAYKLRDPQVVYLVESLHKSSIEDPCPVIIRGSQMDFLANLSNFEHLNEGKQDADGKFLTCANFCSKTKTESTMFYLENADILQVSVLLNSSEKSRESAAPSVQYLPGSY